MNSGNNSCAPKKLRQLSITDLFGPCQKKRKVESAGLFNRDDSRGGGSLEFDAVAKNSTERKMEKQCLSEKRNDAITAQINSSKFEQQTDQCQSNRGGESSTEHSSSSQQLINDIIAERSEQCSQFLHRDIPDDDDISQLTPDHKKKDSIGQKQISAKENKEDKLLIYDSPDMFADTFPTQDFDINQQFGDDETSECKWKGKPKSLLKVAPECLPILPKLKPLTTHTILFDTTFFDFGPPPPSWSTYVDAWDSIHVKLPCSPKSLFPVVINKNTTLKQRWELIENALLNDMKSANDLEKAIKSYNVKMNQPFYILRALLNDCFNDEERTEFFAKTLPEMVKLALSLPALITQPIPLLTRQRAHCITISQQQCACLLANAFFCTFPRRNSTNPDAEYSNYPTINFNRLHIGKATRDKKGVHIEKLKTLLHYFKRVTTDMPSGVVTFERKVCQEFPVWSKSPSKLCGLHVRSKGLIEDEGKGMLQIDFANKFIGGGVLSSGMVQEEILFCIFPELLISRLFTEVMDDNECVCVTAKWTNTRLEMLGESLISCTVVSKIRTILTSLQLLPQEIGAVELFVEIQFLKLYCK